MGTSGIVRFAWGVVLAGMVAAGAARAEVTIYVSPSGDDRSSGGAAVTSGSDGPLATPAAALAAASESRAPATEPITIELAGGTYFLTQPLIFSPASNRDRPVTIEAARGANVVLSGGVRIEGWKPDQLNERNCWSASLPADEALPTFRELWVDGRRATRARFPQHGYLSVPTGIAPAKSYTQGQMVLPFGAGEVPDFALAPNVEAVVMDHWNDSRVPILAVDTEHHQFRLGKRTVFANEPGDLFWLEGSASWLDAPGEWYADETARKVYYLPLVGQDMAKAEVIAPRLSSLLEIAGDANVGGAISNITLRGITFAHTEWKLPPAQSTAATQPAPNTDDAPPTAPVSGFLQSEIGVPAAVQLRYATRCKLESCRFEHMGTYCLALGEGSQFDTVSRDVFTDMGAGGIKIGRTSLLPYPVRANDPAPAQRRETYGNTVADCRITDGGHFYPASVGVWIGQSYENDIVHNEVGDFYQIGISVGWTWGYGRATAMGNCIEDNLIHHLGVKSNGDGPIMSDLAGIYMLGPQPGSVVRGNVIHDTAGLKYGGWGIYNDEGASGILVENNLVYRTTHGAYHVNYGQDNIVRNNIFAEGRQWQIARTHAEQHRSFTFEHNIVYGSAPKMFSTTSSSGVRFDDNLYWRTGGDESAITFGKLKWAQWQAAGNDAHSIIADPGFVDPDHGDFSLKPGSAALRVGFEPFDWRAAGPR